jgi:hypothetical protein
MGRGVMYNAGMGVGSMTSLCSWSPFYAHRAHGFGDGGHGADRVILRLLQIGISLCKGDK